MNALNRKLKSPPQTVHKVFPESNVWVWWDLALLLAVLAVLGVLALSCLGVAKSGHLSRSAQRVASSLTAHRMASESTTRTSTSLRCRGKTQRMQGIQQTWSSSDVHNLDSTYLSTSMCQARHAFMWGGRGGPSYVVLVQRTRWPFVWTTRRRRGGRNMEGGETGKRSDADAKGKRRKQRLGTR